MTGQLVDSSLHNLEIHKTLILQPHFVERKTKPARLKDLSSASALSLLTNAAKFQDICKYNNVVSISTAEVDSGPQKMNIYESEKAS